MKRALYVLILLACLTACHSVRKVPDNPILKIEYGNGGGFVGSVTTNTLMADGRLILPNHTSRAIAPAQMDTVLSLAGRISTSYVRPSNTFVFVHIYRPNDTIRCSWSFGDKNVDRNVQSLYFKLNRL